MNKWIILLCLWSPWLIAGSKSYGNAMIQEVVSVYDADTFRVNIAGWPDLIGKNISIHADGFDAPEIRARSDQPIASGRQGLYS